MNVRADWRETVATLTPAFAERAARLDDGDEFEVGPYVLRWRSAQESGDYNANDNGAIAVTGGHPA